MNELRAFVGHSFTPDDGSVVRVFLDYLNTIKKLNIGFDWVHAEPAKPEELANKVKGLIKDKNLFIGICTKKESVINPSELNDTFFSNNIFKARRDSFIDKTSDWIIQEIGLAIGLGLKLILLLEEGVKRPGGLQGDIEYIPFNRLGPEKAFPKILEMIQSQLPKTKDEKRVVIDEDKQVAPETKAEKLEDTIKNWLEPNDNWELEDYQRGYIHALFGEDFSKPLEIKEAYLASSLADTEQKKASWKSSCEYWLITNGKGGSLKKLEDLANQNIDIAEIQIDLARAYQHFEKHFNAAERFQIAADKSEGVKKSRFLGFKANSLYEAGRVGEGEVVIEQIRKIASKIEDGEAEFIKCLIKNAGLKEDKGLLFSLREWYLELFPDDKDMRFSIAYEYSQENQHDIALYHYLKINYKERSPVAWNNLGVQFAHFELHKKSVDAYKKAKDKKETLAMDNLAKKLLNAGFYDEAYELCQEALKVEGYHKNIGHSITALKNIDEDEGEKEKEVLKGIGPLSSFYKTFGMSLLKASVETLALDWTGPKCPLEVKINEGVFVAEGEYETQGVLNSLTQLASVAGSDLGKAEIQTYKVVYEGSVSGSTIQGKVTIERTDKVERKTLLSIMGNTKKVMMIISEDLSEIKVYEQNSSNSEFYSFKRM